MEKEKEYEKKKDNESDIFELTKPKSKKSKPVVIESSESSSDEVDGMIHDSQIKKKLFK